MREHVEMIRLFMRDVDAVTAARQQGGSEAYKELIDLFWSDGERRTQRLRELIDEGNIESFVTEVHGLKSAAANIGAMKLSTIAREHEEAGKRRDLEFIEKNNEELFARYDLVLGEIRRALKLCGYGRFAPVDNSTLPGIDNPELKERVADALDALQDFRSKDAAKSVEELLGFAIPDDARDKLLDIQGQLKLYEDDRAEELLSELLESL